MQPSEHSELARFLSEALSYWRADLSRFSLTVWQQACEPFSLEQVRKAFTAHATDPQRGMFAPKVADIVRVLQGRPHENHQHHPPCDAHRRREPMRRL